jgi:endoglucanase
VKKNNAKFVSLILFLFSFSISTFAQNNSFVRINQLGYLPDDTKKALVVSKSELSGQFQVINSTTKEIVFKAAFKPAPASNWGSPFPFTYELDFSAFRQTGKFSLQLENSQDFPSIFDR